MSSKKIPAAQGDADRASGWFRLETERRDDTLNQLTPQLAFLARLLGACDPALLAAVLANFACVGGR
jgi:hypothetical protein